jgi:hypothetical protein
MNINSTWKKRKHTIAPAKEASPATWPVRLNIGEIYDTLNDV